MPFPARLLDADEEIVLDLHRHWLFLVVPSCVLAAAVIVAVVVSTWTRRGVVLIPFLVAVLVALGWFLLRVARWAGTNLVVTNRRLVLRAGVFRQGQELVLERIAGVTVTRSLFARMLGTGDLVIDAAGERGRRMFRGCPHPVRVRDEIHDQIERALSRPAGPPAAGGGEESPFGQLERLDDLRRRGVISQAEFDTKKTQILGRL